MRRRVYSNEFMIHLAIEAAKQCGSFEKIRIRGLAQMGDCSNGSLLDPTVLQKFFQH